MSIDITKKVKSVSYEGVDLPMVQGISKGIIDGSLTEYDNTKMEATSIMPNRFQNFTALTKVKLTGITDVKDYTCDGCTALEELEIDSGTTAIRNYAFRNNTAVKTLTFNNPSALTILGDYAFYSIGANRANASGNRLVFNLKNTGVGTISQYAFGGTSSAKVKYADIYLPASVTTIGAYAFTYCDNVKIYLQNMVAPTLQSTSFSSATNIKLYIPFGAMHSFQTATNWSTLTSSMVGYAPAGTFDQDELLPDYNAEGYALTWYSDEALTTQVTTATDPSAVYYCTIGSTKVAVGIKSVFTYDASLVITGSDNRVYKQGYGVLPGVVLTFTATPAVSGYTPYIFTVNGATISSGDTYTVLADTDIMVNCIYWDGEHIPASPVFADNSWVQIASVIRAGGAASIGWQVGDTKEISYQGTTLHVRLSDLQTGRYQYANSTNTTNAVLEFVELLPTTYQMNSSGTNAGGWGGSALKTTLNSTILNNLPSDLAAILEEVNVKAANGGGSNYTQIEDVAGKLFLPAEVEVASQSNSKSGEGTRWDYYVGATDSTRIKKQNGSANTWWLRSPRGSSTASFCFIYNNGLPNNSNASSSIGVAVCFAL